jgi:hypothetical protein
MIQKKDARNAPRPLSTPAMQMLVKSHPGAALLSAITLGFLLGRVFSEKS